MEDIKAKIHIFFDVLDKSDGIVLSDVSSDERLEVQMLDELLTEGLQLVLSDPIHQLKIPISVFGELEENIFKFLPRLPERPNA